MHAPLLDLGHELGGLQVGLDPTVATATALASIPRVEMLDVPAAVPCPVTLDYRQHLIDRGGAVRGLGQPPIQQAVQSLGFVADQIAPETAFAHAKQARRLRRLAESPLVPSLIRFFESHLPNLL